MTERPPTPMLEKMSAVSDSSQPIGAFLDWLFNDQHVHLMRWDEQVEHRACPRTWPSRRDHEEIQTAVDDLRELEAELKGLDPAMLAPRNVPPPPPHPDNCVCGGTGLIENRMEDWVPWGAGIQPILARYFDIDLDAANDERNALLAWVREQNQ